MLEQENAIAGRAWRDAASLFVLAAARSGDRADAARRLAELASTPPRFASSAELADAELHRAQALAELERRPEATAVAWAVLPLLEQQQVDSPRRTALERLLAPA